LNAKTTIFLSVFTVFLISLAVANATFWGSYVPYEELTIDYTEFITTGITWHPLSKSYSTSNLVIGVAPQSIAFNPSATQQKFVIEIAGSSTDTHLDLAFYSTGVIDVVATTPAGASKLCDTSSSGVSWNSISYVLVKLNGTSITVVGNDTVLCSTQWAGLPSQIAQIGASGYDNALTGGSVVVGILYDPFSGLSTNLSGLISQLLPLMIAIIPIAVPLMFLRAVLKPLESILD